MAYTDPKELQGMAEHYGWQLIEHQPGCAMISFWKLIDGYRARINVYYTKMTVATVVKHPLKGINQLYRRHVSRRLMERIFENPRVHTWHNWLSHGYRYRGDR